MSTERVKVESIRASEERLREQEQLLAQTQRIARIGSWSVDLATQVATWTDETYRLYGVSPESFVPSAGAIIGLIHPDDRGAMQEWIGAAAAGEVPGPLEFCVPLPDGSARWLCGQGELIRDDDGRPVRLIGTVQDITERKRVEAALRESERKNNAILEAIPDLMFLVNRDGVFLDYLAHSTSDLYAAPDKIIGGRMQELLPPDFADLAMRYLNSALDSGAVQAFEFSLPMPDGLRHYEARMAASGMDQVVSMVRNITDRVIRSQAEQALIEERNLLVSLLTASFDHIYFKDRSSRFIRVNDILARELGVKDPHDLLGKTDFDLFEEKCARRFFDREQQVMVTGRPVVGLEEQEVWLDGSVTWASTTLVPLRDSDEYITGVIGISRDITEKKQAEQALQQERDRLRQILDAQFGFVAVYALDGAIVEVNQTPLTLMGLSRGEVLGRLFWDIGWFEPGTVPQVQAASQSAAQGEAVNIEIVARFPGLGRRDVDTVFAPLRNAAGNVTNVIGFGVDVTERKQAEDAVQAINVRLNEAQRIAQIGSWELDLTNSALLWSDEIFRIFEIDPAQFGASYEAFLNAIHPEDREMIHAAYTSSVENQQPYNIVHRLLMADGRIKFVRERCVTHYDAAGHPLRSLGTVQDITETKLAVDALRESELRFRTFVEHATDAFILHGEGGVILDVNSRCCEMLQYARDELIGANVFKIDAEITPERLQSYTERLDRGETVSIETKHKRKDGTLFPVESRIRRFYVDGRRHALSLTRDITERMQAEQQRQELDERLRIVLENINDGFFILDRDWRYVEINRAGAAMVGRTPEQLIGCRYLDEFPDASGTIWEKTYAHVMHTGKAATAEEFYEPLNKWFEARVYPFASGVSVFFTDITERKQVEVTLRHSEQRFRTFVEHSTDSFYLHGEEGIILDVNQRAGEILGYSRDELIGADVSLIDPDITPEGMANIGNRLGRGETVSFESRHRRKDGTIFPVEVRMRPFTIDNRSFAVALAQDITQRRQIDDSLRLQSQVLHYMSEGVGFCDESGRLLFANAALEAMFGYDPGELLGQQVTVLNDATPEENALIVADVMGTIQTQGRWQGEFRNRRKDGSVFYTQADISPLKLHDQTCFVSVQQDITERKRAEKQVSKLREELDHMSRLGAVGELTAGIAHELNQPLAAVANYAYALWSTLEQQSSVGRDPVLQTCRTMAGWLEVQAVRCGDIIRRLQGLIRQQPTVRAAVPIDQLVSDVVDLLAAELQSAKIDLELDLPQDLPVVTADLIQIQQVLFNLCRNAIEAIDASATDRRIQISARLIDPDGLEVRVRDWGPGISADIGEEVFTPLVTTKSHGLGFGLSISRRIVEAHGGRLWIASEVSPGAEFRFSLPVSTNDQTRLSTIN